MISALVVNYNGERWLDRCLASLGEPPPADLQIVLVDNCSSDASLELVKRRFPHVQLLRMGHNVGFAVATNLAAASSDGDALLLLNNDAWLEPGALEAMRKRLDRKPSIGLVAPRLVSLDGRPQFVWSPDRSLVGAAVQRMRNRFEGHSFNHGFLVRLLRLLLGPGWYTGACLLIRRRAFDEVGGFDPGFFMYHEDADLCLRMRRRGWRLAFEPRARVVHAGGLRPVDEQTQLHYRQSQAYYYSKHRPRWEEEIVWKYLVKLYAEAEPGTHGTEDAVADWLRTGGVAEQPLAAALEALAGALKKGGLPPHTMQHLREELLEAESLEAVSEARDV
jgi:GT2 family glycosyltransferase